MKRGGKEKESLVSAYHEFQLMHRMVYVIDYMVGHDIIYYDIIEIINVADTPL